MTCFTVRGGKDVYFFIYAKSELNVFRRSDAKGNIVFGSEPLLFRNCSLFFLKCILVKFRDWNGWWSIAICDATICKKSRYLKERSLRIAGEGRTGKFGRRAKILWAPIWGGPKIFWPILGEDHKFSDACLTMKLERKLKTRRKERHSTTIRPQNYLALQNNSFNWNGWIMCNFSLQQTLPYTQ